MPTKYQINKLNKQALKNLNKKAERRSSFKPIKNWNLTCIENVQAEIGRSVMIEARDYVQALEHALYVAGFSLEKQLKKA